MNSKNTEEIKLEKEKTKLKIIIYIFIILIPILFLSWFIYSTYLSFKALEKDLSKNTYHVLNLTDDNEKEVTDILKNENKSYCNSIYKIEYNHRFPHGTNIKIYCKEDKDIIFNSSDSQVLKYIEKNGIIERR